MNAVKVLGLGLILIFLCGCIPSLYPIYTDQNLVDLPQLLGTWEEDGGEEANTWQFAANDSSSYRLVYTEDGEPGFFIAHVAKLGEYLFIDITPEYPDSMSQSQRDLLVPSHMFGRVQVIEDTLQIGWIDGEWLKSAIDSGKVNLQFAALESGDILMNTTEELQAFAIKYAADTAVFPFSNLFRLVPQDTI